MNVMVLGHNGMLGHMVVKYLTDQKVNLKTTPHRYPSNEFKQDVISFGGDYIVNCIGAIPQKTKIFSINIDLPIWLSKNINIKILHPGTDCEEDNDEYGISKKTAKEYIINNSPHIKILKSSIIGPELNSKSSLLEWFLNSKSEVQGYSNAMWSGVTTLEWAKHCYNILNNWDNFDKENIIISTCLSKYNLLLLIKEIFNKNIDIISNDKVIIDKCLTLGNLISSPIETQLIELKKYYYGGK